MRQILKVEHRRDPFPVRLGECSRNSVINKEGDPIYFWDRYFGCNLIIAKPRYGKSSACKTILVQLANKSSRRCIVIDINGEWKSHVVHRNFNAPYPECVPLKKFKLHENLAIGLQDIKSPYDWVYLTGCSYKAGEILHNINLHLRDVHQDDPDSFAEILEGFPRDGSSIYSWNKIYGHKYFLKQAPHIATVGSINQNFPAVQAWLYHPFDDDRKRVTSWYHEIKDYQVNIINLEVNDSTEKRYSSYIIGLILQQLEPFLHKLQPAIFCEEADFYFDDKVDVPSFSREMGIKYVTKNAKYGVAMYFIAQTKSQLAYEIRQNWSTQILGALAETEEQGYKLRYDIDNGIREFILIDALKGQSPVFFYPMMCPCRI